MQSLTLGDRADAKKSYRELFGSQMTELGEMVVEKEVGRMLGAEIATFVADHRPDRPGLGTSLQAHCCESVIVNESLVV